MRIAVIPARGGSSRIPGKNIKLFAGRPMLAWPIGAAKESGLFEHILVSTDSPEIADIAVRYGAEAPFVRPAELSDNYTPTAPVLLHALEWIAAHWGEPERFCCIYPTSPFLQAKDLRAGLAVLENAGAPCSLSATTFDFPILRAFRRESDGSLAYNWPEHELTRSQDLPEFLHDAGQFYWLRTAEFVRQKRLAMPGVRPVLLPRHRVVDLDTPEDWEMAELLAKAAGLGESR